MPAAFGLLLLCLSFLFLPWPSFSAEYTTRYDGYIKNATEKWWVDLPVWKLWKAQLIAESALDPNAVSAVGAEGLAQFMPSTWSDAIRALGWPQIVSRRDAAYAVEGGAWYMRRLRSTWKPRGDRTPLESNWLAAASYNRGTGNVLRDQAACGDALLWSGIEPCTGKITVETVNYVKHIKQYWGALGQ